MIAWRVTMPLQHLTTRKFKFCEIYRVNYFWTFHFSSHHSKNLTESEFNWDCEDLSILISRQTYQLLLVSACGIYIYIYRERERERDRERGWCERERRKEKERERFKICGNLIQGVIEILITF